MSLIRTLPYACGSSLRCMTVAPYLSLFFLFASLQKKRRKVRSRESSKDKRTKASGEGKTPYLPVSLHLRFKRENTLPDIPIDCIGISAGYIRFIHTSNKYGFSPCSKVFRIKKKPRAETEGDIWSFLLPPIG